MTRARSASGLSSGSASRLVSMVAPARVRSAYGDMTKAAAGMGQAVIAGVDQGGDGEPAAGGLSREGDVRWGCAVVQEGFVGCQSVVDRCRIRMLGGEPVVDGD